MGSVVKAVKGIFGFGGGQQQPAPPPVAPPPARAPRAGDPGESGSPQRRARQRALNRKGGRASILAGETGGFQAPAGVSRGGGSVLGG